MREEKSSKARCRITVAPVRDRNNSRLYVATFTEGLEMPRGREGSSLMRRGISMSHDRIGFDALQAT